MTATSTTSGRHRRSPRSRSQRRSPRRRSRRPRRQNHRPRPEPSPPRQRPHRPRRDRRPPRSRPRPKKLPPPKTALSTSHSSPAPCAPEPSSTPASPASSTPPPTPKPEPAALSSRVMNHPQLNHKVEVVSGLLAEECGQMLTNFFLQRRGKKSQEPYPTSEESKQIGGAD